MRARRAALSAVALLVALGAGCAPHGDASPRPPSGSGTPSGYAEMQKKVNAAQSAAAAADRDAAGDADR
ncbi:hypothetical protein [Streptomyces sp. NPDC007905]|uniref:hypothetical protein n=1 Tax=Streptomyces sp. NPDC007905 TaxID=3364788 RepID=UPI0036EBCD17